jgi:hypothetical protein
LRFHQHNCLPIALTSSLRLSPLLFFHLLDAYSRLQAIEMSNELYDCVLYGNLERFKQLVEGGTNVNEIGDGGVTALLLAGLNGEFEILVYLVEHGAEVTHTDSKGMTALLCASIYGHVQSVEYLLEHGAKITERSNDGLTALLWAAEYGHLELMQYLLSSEGGASITEKDNEGDTAFLIAATGPCHPSMVQWLLEYGGAQITDTYYDGSSVCTANWREGLPATIKSAYTKSDDGEYVFIDDEYIANGDIVALTAMLRVMVLHGGPPESLAKDLAPPFQRIVQDGARLRARLPAYLTQRRALVDAHCSLLPPLGDIVHGYEKPTTTDELWATGLGAPQQRGKRSRPERGQSPEQRRSVRLRQKRK